MKNDTGQAPGQVQIPIQDPTVSEEYPTALAARMASRFALEAPIEAFDFPEKGNINQHTFVIRAGRGSQVGDFLLQRINHLVFTRPRSVMASMILCIDAQRRGVEQGHLPAGQIWEAITLVPTRSQQLYLENASLKGTNFWRLMVKIPNCQTFKQLGQVPRKEDRLLLAEEAGRGLAIFGDLTADMDVSLLESPLPGYRNTRLYFNQLRSVLQGSRTPEQAGGLLPEDELLLQSTREHFLVHLPEREFERRMADTQLTPYIELAKGQRDFAMTLLRGMEKGTIRRVAIHGDTKLDNFLFDAESGRVKALVDLDTIMAHSWLADWGDMVRSLVNLAGEKERDLEKVRVDIEVYRALARGFLAAARRVTPAEINLMVDAVQIIALELGIRFLADYLRGDTYFRLGPTDSPDLNKARAMVQLKLFEELVECRDLAEDCIEGLASESAGG